jgi:hypothetical protein
MNEELMKSIGWIKETHTIFGKPQIRWRREGFEVLDSLMDEIYDKLEQSIKQKYDEQFELLKKDINDHHLIHEDVRKEVLEIINKAQRGELR